MIRQTTGLLSLLICDKCHMLTTLILRI